MKSLAIDMILLGARELVRYLHNEYIDIVTINECIEKYCAEVKKNVLILDCKNDSFYSIKDLIIENNTGVTNSIIISKEGNFDITMDMIVSDKFVYNYDAFYDRVNESIRYIFDSESWFTIDALHQTTTLNTVAKSIVYKLCLVDIIFKILIDFRLSYNADYNDILDSICYSTWMNNLLNSKDFGNIRINVNDVVYLKPRIWINKDIINFSCTLSSCKKQ